jgi:predicted ribosome quality control (RQC) complex YloA/Tae2 family protein
MPKNLKFREFKTKSGTTILAGRDAESNEFLVEQCKPNEEVFHTVAVGSPFVNIKSNKPSSDEIKQAALICAKYSKAWRDSKKDIAIHQFKGRDIYKLPLMKVGTFGVKKTKNIKIKKSEIESFEKELDSCNVDNITRNK